MAEQVDDFIDRIHIGHRVEVGLYDLNDRLVAVGRGILAVHNVMGTVNGVWFRDTQGDAPDLSWNSGDAKVLVTFDPEEKRF